MVGWVKKSPQPDPCTPLREREREREHFLYRKNMHRMEEIEWQIYNKMMRIKRGKIRKIKGQNNI